MGMSSLVVGRHCSTARLGRNGLQQACESLFHLRQMAGRGGDERQPLLSKENGGGVRTVRINGQIPFNKGGE
jgi:hypothetical protein